MIKETHIFHHISLRASGVVRYRADIAQLVEQLIRNQQVSGSTPLVGSNDFRHLWFIL